MSDENEPPSQTSIKDAFKPGEEGSALPSLFKPDEMDIYCNKVTKESFIFHAKDVNYDAIERLEYDHQDHSVQVFNKDGTVLNLGVKIQWLIRPYFSKAEEVQIVQTKDGTAINGTFVKLLHKNQ